MAINAPNGAYSSLLGTVSSSILTTSTATASSMTSLATRISNSSALTASSAIDPETCWTIRSKTICIVPEKTVVDGQTTMELETTTLGSINSQAVTTTSAPTCWTVRSQTLCIVPEKTVINGQATTELETTTLGSIISQAATTTTSPTCWTVRSYTLCIVPEKTVIDGQTTTELETTTLGFITSQAATTTSSTPSSTYTPPPMITSPPEPSGPMYGVYIALWAYTTEIPGVEGLPPNPYYLYNDLIWVSAASATASSDLLAGPQYCVTDGVDSTITITAIPTINQQHPYPTSSITSLQPSGTSGPLCDWIPDLNDDGPGSLNCDTKPTSISCVLPLQAATTCGSLDIEVYPVVQCIWQGE